jgi:hypothetical protein
MTRSLYLALSSMLTSFHPVRSLDTVTRSSSLNTIMRFDSFSIDGTSPDIRLVHATWNFSVICDSIQVIGTLGH